MKPHILLVALLLAVLLPTSVHAQACKPSDSGACGKNAACKELAAGSGQFFCVATTVNATGCKESTDCTSGHICSISAGKSTGTCVFPTACSPACNTTTEQCLDGTCAPKGSATQCTPACSGSQTCVRGVCSSSGGTPTLDTGGGTGSASGGGGVGTTKAGGGTGTTDAGGGTGGIRETLKNPLKFDSLPKLMEAILGAVVQLGAILLVFMLVWVGFLFVVAQGNPEKLSSARSALIWTLIGGMILLGATAISKVIEATVTSIT